MSTSLLPFAQLDFAGELGLADGRYLVRRDGEPSEVLVCSLLGAQSGRRRRRTRARPIEGEAAPKPLAVTRLTVVTPEDLGGAAEAARWLDRICADPEAAETFLAEAVRLINRALQAHATAAQDPYVHEVSTLRAVATRLGYGEGDQVADGQWTDARELERGEPRRRRADSLQPQERVAAVLGGREEMAACETLLLRARLDLDQGRTREAALQLDAGLRALVVELSESTGPQQRDDLETVIGRRERVGAIANEVLAGGAREDPAGELDETLRICERMLRRHRLRPDL